MPALFVPIFVAAVAVGVYVASQTRKRVSLAWAQAAEQLGLQFRPAPAFGRPEIEGRIDQLAIEVDSVTRGSGNTRHVFTRYRVSYPERDFDFRLTRETAVARIGKLFFTQDVETGDRLFDDAFIVKSEDPDRVAAMLSPMVRATLVRLAVSYPGVVVDEARITFEHRGLDDSADRIVTTTRRLVGAAFQVAGLASPSPEMDEAVAARRRGDLTEAAGRLRDVVAARRDDLEARMMEAETLAEAGETDEAAARLDELAVDLPADPEVKGWKQRMERVRAAPTPAPTGPAVDADELAERLFRGTSLSFETSDRFDAEYRGRPVRWTGRVKSVRDYRYDSDLGEGPGTKAVVTVATIDHDLYGEAEIDAVVALPAGSGDGVERHDQITFEGRLARIDSMMRNVFVEDGRLV